MPLFRLKADVEFEASGIDDAMHKLSTHFHDMATKGLEGNDLFQRGEIQLKPAEDFED
jgi:hypothetical protein